MALPNVALWRLCRVPLARVCERVLGGVQLRLVHEREALPLDARNDKNNREWREALVRTRTRARAWLRLPALATLPARRVSRSRSGASTGASRACGRRRRGSRRWGPSCS